MTNLNSLRMVSQNVSDRLNEDIGANLEDKYLGEGFLSASEKESGWGLEIPNAKIDQEAVDQINTLALADCPEVKDSTEIDRKAAKILFKGMKEFPPALACQDLIWARLSHVELFAYAQKRWLNSEAPREENLERVKKRFFATNRRSYQRENAVSRLWWAGYFSELAVDASSGVTFDKALSVLFKTQEQLNNLLDRNAISAIIPLLQGLVKIIDKHPELSKRESWREFIPIVNRNCSGQLFHLYKPEEIEQTLSGCFVEISSSANE